YIGHDDIWDWQHLAMLHALLESRANTDFAVSGCISYGPPESNFYRVTGFFENPGDEFIHFVPPSAIMASSATAQGSRPPIESVWSRVTRRAELGAAEHDRRKVERHLLSRRVSDLGADDGVEGRADRCRQ
ncbi:MAG: hypothetical protein HC850_16185, partial [Rhodomicrobium sp.]|nr:hypothetical protein [Rhodomicrobium sp.]